jgi:hypothetical protein
MDAPSLSLRFLQGQGGDFDVQCVGYAETAQKDSIDYVVSIPLPDPAAR